MKRKRRVDQTEMERNREGGKEYDGGRERDGMIKEEMGRKRRDGKLKEKRWEGREGMVW